MVEESFADRLVRAAKAAGSLLALATLLGVEPRLLYCWIADVERPSVEQQRLFTHRLSALIPENGIHSIR